MIKRVDSSYYKFQLRFRGQLVENSVDAYDAANTIIATANILQEIAEIKLGTETSDKLHFNIQAFKQGSHITDFIIHSTEFAVQNAPALLPLASTVYTVGKSLLESLKLLIEIKTALKGGQPAKISPEANGQFLLQVTGDHNTINYHISAQDLRMLQSKSIEKNTEKAVQPLTKQDSPVDSIDYIPQDVEPVEISKEEAQYLVSTDALQTHDKMKYKVTISKIDRKVCSGFADIGSRRVSFTFPKDLEQEKFHLLVESLEHKIQIFIIGTVIMDYEGNPKQITITDVENEIKLFS